MGRHPIEVVSQRAASGFRAADGIFALSDIHAEKELSPDYREVLEGWRDAFDSMLDTSPGLNLSDSQFERDLQMDVWDMLEHHHAATDREAYLTMLRDTATALLESETPTWSDEVEEFQKFLSAFQEYQLGKMSEERGGCF